MSLEAEKSTDSVSESATLLKTTADEPSKAAETVVDENLEEPRSRWTSFIAPTIIAIALRFIAYTYFCDYLEDNSAFVAPWNSFQRLRDAVSLWQQGIGLYSGGFHSMPWLAFAFAPILNYTYLLLGIFTAFDLLAALFLYKFTSEFLAGKDERPMESGRMVYSIYILNPLTIGVCAVFNLSSFINLLLAAALYFNYKKNTWVTLVLVSLVSQLNIYYIALVFAISGKEQENGSKSEHSISKYAKHFLFVAALYAANGLLVNLGDVFEGNVMFFMRVEDYTPNTGIFWYMFTEVFPHYRPLFLIVFQINAFLYVVPLWRIMRDDLLVLWFVYLQLIAIISSYPTYAEFCACLPLFFTFTMYHKYYKLIYIITLALLISFGTSVITLTQWLQTSSGNANFYFGSCTTYQLALAGLLFEVVNAYVLCRDIEWSGVEDPKIHRFFLNVPAFRPKKLE